MNVFLIPSWYPSLADPISGVFVAEQARNFAELNPDIRMAISVAGGGDFSIPLQRPWQAPGVLRRYICSRPSERLVLPNLIEMHQPVLHWTFRLSGGNLRALLRAHDKHLLRVMAEAGKVSLIHAHVSYPAGWIAMKLSERYGIPYIITEHMGPFPFNTPQFIRNGKLTDWIRRPLEKAAMTIAVSPSLARRIESFGLACPQVIPNMLDESRFTCSPMPAVVKEPIFLTLASMVRGKGVEVLLQAIHLLAKRGIRYRHIIAGDGPEYRKFRTLADSLGPRESIEWLGRVGRDEVPALFRHCHVFVLPSHHESFGIVYAEAIASGRPVIATRCGGPESIVNENNGLLVPVNSPEALAEAMMRMAGNLRNYQEQVIRADFMKRFSRQVVTEKIRQLYVSIAGDDAAKTSPSTAKTKTVLVLSLSDLGRDPRVSRQLTCLARHYRVTAAGLAAPNLAGLQFAPITYRSTLASRLKDAVLLALRQYETYYWTRHHVKSAMRSLSGQEYDVIVANDLSMLPLALKIANSKTRIVFDAHEYSPLEYEDLLVWRLLFKKYNHAFCRKYLPAAHGMMTVCPRISEEYRRNFGVNSIVVTNAPRYQNLPPQPVKPDSIRLIHHGAAIPSRHLGQMIEMMRFLDERFHLDLMLVSTSRRYLNKLKQLAHADRRVRFLDPVPMADLPAVCNSYDVGVFLLPPVSFNSAHALPNKFFEFIQSRLAVAIGPSPEMARVVREYDCGVIAGDFSAQAMAQALSGLTAERIAYYKQQSHRAAADLCAEKNEQLILNLIEGN